MSNLLTQYRRSLNYELSRMGFGLGYPTNGLMLEAEGSTLYATLGDRTLKFDVYLAAKSLWGKSLASYPQWSYFKRWGKYDTVRDNPCHRPQRRGKDE